MNRTSSMLIAPLLAVAALLRAGPPAGAAVPVGSVAPALVATTLDGKTIELATMRGQVVVIHFWATWCPPCREEMPVLDAFYRAHHGEGLELIAVSIDRKRDLRDVEKVMKAFSFPAVLVAAATANGWGTPDAMPLTYVVDSSGAIHSVLRPGKGILTTEQLRAEIEPLLPRNTSAPGHTP